MTKSDSSSTATPDTSASDVPALASAAHDDSSAGQTEPVFVADAFDTPPVAPPDAAEGAHDSADESADESAQTPAELAKAAEEEEMKDMKATLLDSAELATRAASLAATAGGEMQKASEKLLTTVAAQKKQYTIFLIIVGSLLLITSILFTVMSIRLQGRVNQLDSMVLAVGKRVVSMDASLEMVNSASEAIGEVKAKQDVITEAQARLEKSLEEYMKASASGPEQAMKQIDTKNQEMIKLIQGLDTKLQAQAAGVKSLSSQLQQLQGANHNAAGLKKEVESLVRQQKERQAQQEAIAKAPPPPPPAPVAAPVKPRERLVQYPRVSASGPTSEKP